MRFRPSVSSTTFSRNFSIESSRSFLSPFSAAVPASCTIGGVHDSVVLIILPIVSATSTDATAKPRRQPLMLYDLLNVYAPTHCSSMPGSLKIE